MLKTRKQMEMEIEQLRAERDHYKRRSALMNEDPLPMCDNVACLSCMYAVYKRDCVGNVHLIGCGRKRKCHHYAPVEQFTMSERVQEEVQKRSFASERSITQ